jgi:2-iminoacetate synthase
MSFYDVYDRFKNFDFTKYINNLNIGNIEKMIYKDRIDELEFLALLSEKSDDFLENMAKRAKDITIQHFGKVMFLYTPMYISNYCVNQCVYCGFNVKNEFDRKKLNFMEIEEEAKIISDKGFRHILILTGESRIHSPIDYLYQSIKILKKYFDSISIEIYPLNEDEYKRLIDAGVDGLTIYQEVYNEKLYKKLHLSGPKKDYNYRLQAPERACKANIRSVNIGALLGLDNWVKEAFFTGIHAKYLQDKYPDVEISISVPRIRPHFGLFKPKCIVTDKELVKILLAYRIFMPRGGISISTRENSYLRDNLVGLGVTKMSADSTTKVGGHSSKKPGEGQFNISDDRTAKEMKDMLLKKGYQPIFKDWQFI